MSVEDSWYTIDKDTGEKVRTKRHGRGKRWRVRNRGARTLSFDKKSDAENYDTSVKADLMRGLTPFDHKAGLITFDDYALNTWLDEHHYTGRSRKTVESRIRNHMSPFFGSKRMCDIKQSTYKAWQAHMRAKRKPGGEPYAEATIRAVYVAFGSIMRAAVADGVKSGHPCDGVKDTPKPAQRKVITVWEQARVDAVLSGVDDRQRPIPLVSATCGHRPGESFAVAVEDINFLRKKITVQHQVQRVNGKLTLTPPKGGKVRTVPLPDVTGYALAEHIKRHGTITVTCQCCNRENHVLFFDGKNLLRPDTWNAEQWRPAVELAGVTWVPRKTGQHNLRHFYASMLIYGGAPITMVRDYMGHSSVKITGDVYGHLFEDAGERALKTINSAFGAGVYPLRTAEQG